jgi:hypothetical protein
MGLKATTNMTRSKPEETEKLRAENRGLKEALKKLQQEHSELQRKLDLFVTEHRLFGWFGKLVILGPRLEESIRRWLAKAKPSNPVPVDETAAVGAAIIHRVLRLGAITLIAFIVPQVLIVWQNILIRSQNAYFREQLVELRKQLDLQSRQITLQEEQGDFTKRSELLALVYDGKTNGVSSKVRVDALKALVRLENKLLDRDRSTGPPIDLRNVDFSCVESGSPDCPDFSGAWLVRTDFSGSDFRGANFEMADLRDSRFIGSNLMQAKFYGADLEGAKFRDELPGFITMSVVSANPGPALEMFESSGFTVIHYFALRTIYKRFMKSKNFPYFYTPFEYGIEEANNDTGLNTLVNKVTRSSDTGGFTIDDSLVDVQTRLPAGVRPRRGVQELWNRLEIYDRILPIQQRANRIFGSYIVDIDVDLPANNRIYCRSRDSNLSNYTLDIYERASSPEQESILREICGDGLVAPNPEPEADS